MSILCMFYQFWACVGLELDENVKLPYFKALFLDYSAILKQPASFMTILLFHEKGLKIVVYIENPLKTCSGKIH